MTHQAGLWSLFTCSKQTGSLEAFNIENIQHVYYIWWTGNSIITIWLHSEVGGWWYLQDFRVICLLPCTPSVHALSTIFDIRSPFTKGLYVCDRGIFWCPPLLTFSHLSPMDLYVCVLWRRPLDCDNFSCPTVHRNFWEATNYFIMNLRV